MLQCYIYKNSFSLLIWSLIEYVTNANFITYIKGNSFTFMEKLWKINASLVYVFICVHSASPPSTKATPLDTHTHAHMLKCTNVHTV